MNEKLKSGGQEYDLFNQPPPPLSSARSINKAEMAKDKGMKKAADHADDKSPGWKDAAYAFLGQFCAAISQHSDEQSREFRTEEFRVWAFDRGLVKPPDDRSFGQVMTRASRAGLIEQVRIDKSTSPTAHRGYISVWRPKFK